MTAFPGFGNDSRPEAEEVAVSLLRSASIEMAASRADDVERLASLLPAGTAVFVSHLPRHSLSQSIVALRAIRNAGFWPVPHIAARRVASCDELRRFIEQAHSSCGVRRVLLVGGDLAKPEGPYLDAEALLADPVFRAVPLQEIAFALYPEVHPLIERQTLDASLTRKIEKAGSLGMEPSLITQLCFNTASLVACLRTAASRFAGIPLHVGIAGPTNAISLARFAHACGVSASFGALSRMGNAGLRLITRSDPMQELAPLAAELAAEPVPAIRGAHVFAFGGVTASAEWIRGRTSKG